MAEPLTVAQQMPSELGLLLRAINQHRPDATPGPIDDTPTPDQPGHPEYHRRQRAEVALNRWTAATPRRYRNARAEHPDITTWADTAARNLYEAGNLLLVGPVGTGKTHQAYGALHRIAEAGPHRYELIAATAADLYGRLRPNGTERGTEAELRRLSRIPWLLIDELGLTKHSEFVEDMTSRLINERYNRSLPTVMTTNLPPRDPNGPDLVDRLGDRVVSRLSQDTRIVPLLGLDLRRQPPPTA